MLSAESTFLFSIYACVRTAITYCRLMLFNNGDKPIPLFMPTHNTYRRTVLVDSSLVFLDFPWLSAALYHDIEAQRTPEFRRSHCL